MTYDVFGGTLSLTQSIIFVNLAILMMLGVSTQLVVGLCRQSIWENQFYYLFGFLFVVFIIIIISCSQIAIVMTYFQLCGEVSAMPHSFVFIHCDDSDLL